MEINTINYEQEAHSGEFGVSAARVMDDPAGPIDALVAPISAVSNANSDSGLILRQLSEGSIENIFDENIYNNSGKQSPVEGEEGFPAGEVLVKPINKSKKWHQREYI